GEERALLVRLIVGAVLAAPVAVIGMSHGAIHALAGAPGRWVQMALATPVVFWCGARFFRSAWNGLRHLRANMDTLIALGAGGGDRFRGAGAGGAGGFGAGGGGARAGAAPGMAGEPPVYFEAAAVIIVLIVLGKYLEARATSRTGAAIRRLIALQPRTARVVRSGTEQDLPVEA